MTHDCLLDAAPAGGPACRVKRAAREEKLWQVQYGRTEAGETSVL